MSDARAQAGVTALPTTVAARGDWTREAARRRARWPNRPLHHGLARLHPGAALAVIGALLTAGFVVAGPAQLAVLLVLIVAVLGLTRRLRAALPYLRFALYVAAFLVVLNPLFSRGGVDVLWRVDLPWFDIRVTLQGLVFGLGSALRLGVVVGAFALYNVALDPDEQLALMSALSFRSGLIVSLATRLFPVLSRDAARISDAQRSRGVELDRGRRRDRAAARLPLLSALLTQSLERAMDVAESMEARGFGRTGRRDWKRGRRWRPADRLTTAAALLAAGALVAGLALGAFRYRFFPLLDDPWAGLADPLWIISLATLGLAAIVVPFVAELRCRR